MDFDTLYIGQKVLFDKNSLTSFARGVFSDEKPIYESYALAVISDIDYFDNTVKLDFSSGLEWWTYTTKICTCEDVLGTFIKELV